MWEINNYNQVVSFLLSLCLGALSCAFYDVIRAFRKASYNTVFALVLKDVFWWICFAIVTFVFLLARTNGEIRGYVIAGEFIGFLLFRISISKFIFPVFSFIFIKIAVLKRKINKITNEFYKKIEVLVLKIFKCIKKLLKNTVKLLYTYKNNLNTENSLNETKTEA